MVAIWLDERQALLPNAGHQISTLIAGEGTLKEICTTPPWEHNSEGRKHREPIAMGIQFPNPGSSSHKSEIPDFDPKKMRQKILLETNLFPLRSRGAMLITPAAET